MKIKRADAIHLLYSAVICLWLFQYITTAKKIFFLGIIWNLLMWRIAIVNEQKRLRRKMVEDFLNDDTEKLSPCEQVQS